MTVPQEITRDIEAIEGLCEEVAANVELMDQHDAGKIAALRRKATEYVEHLRKLWKTRKESP